MLVVTIGLVVMGACVSPWFFAASIILLAFMVRGVISQVADIRAAQLSKAMVVATEPLVDERPQTMSALLRGVSTTPEGVSQGSAGGAYEANRRVLQLLLRQRDVLTMPATSSSPRWSSIRARSHRRKREPEVGTPPVGGSGRV